jgi:large subunit ribosomal protein L9
MKVILIKNVPGVGSTGDMLEVKPGFARNYLIPRKLAIAATVGNVKALDHQKRMVSVRIDQERKEAQDVAGKLVGLSINLARHAGEGDKLFGSVTNRDIADAMAAQGVQVDHRSIKLDEPIKALGVYTISVKLHKDVNAEVKVWVVAAE